MYLRHSCVILSLAVFKMVFFCYFFFSRNLHIIIILYTNIDLNLQINYMDQCVIKYKIRYKIT